MTDAEKWQTLCKMVKSMDMSLVKVKGVIDENREEYWDDNGYGDATEEYTEVVTALDYTSELLGKIGEMIDEDKEPETACNVKEHSTVIELQETFRRLCDAYGVTDLSFISDMDMNFDLSQYYAEIKTEEESDPIMKLVYRPRIELGDDNHNEDVWKDKACVSKEEAVKIATDYQRFISEGAYDGIFIKKEDKETGLSLSASIEVIDAETKNVVYILTIPKKETEA